MPVHPYFKDRLPKEPPQLRGLGDVAEIFLKPAAKLIDAITGTHLATCEPCQARKEWLNEALPFGSKPL